MDKPRRPAAERVALAQRHQIESLDRQFVTLETHAAGLVRDTRDQQSLLSDLDGRMAGLFAAIGVARPEAEALKSSDVRPSLGLTAAESAAVLASLPNFPPNLTVPDGAADWTAYMAEIDNYILSHGVDLERDPMEQMLPPHVAVAVKARFDGWGAEFSARHKLEAYDYTVAGIAGVLAGLADVLLVQVPRHPGFLGGAASEGGWLSNLMKEMFNDLIPPAAIKEIEAIYKVPFDASTNQKLAEKVAGLGPRSHRMSSLGHDPVLGWIIGVRDILTGQFTAIGKDGSIVVQPVAGFEPAEIGLEIFGKIIDAFRVVGGHMASDVATPAGLPPPFFGLLQFLQAGDIEGRTVAEITRIMYREGYDFRHFLAGGVCVTLIEAIVRIAWLVRELQEGRSLMEALPVGDNPRLRTGLLLAHAIAAAVNAGKVAVTKNPLSVSWAQWLAFFGYLLPQMQWLLAGKEHERRAFVEGKLDDGWRELHVAFTADFRSSAVGQAAL